ncbi:MAG: Gfo/Idh/MocA family protein [Saprospiraceae bacterium]
MLKIGVLGAGHLGKIHLKCLGELKKHFDLAGFYDIDRTVSDAVAGQSGVPAFESYEALLGAVDVVDIVTPTTAHYGLASQAIRRGKHVFIEKPVTQTPEEAVALIELSKKHGVVAQVGHVERFNPAMLAVQHLPMNPMFVEAHRLAMFNPRGTDVPVVLDLMIHDIDIVLSLVKSEVKTISASGVPVVSDTPDIANARVEFENGCVANFTASRISMKQMRKVRLFQKDAYISLDFLKKESQILRMYDEENKPADGNFMALETPTGQKFITMEMPEVGEVNAIKMELRVLAECIGNGGAVAVSLEEGYRALKMAHDVMREIGARRF